MNTLDGKPFSEDARMKLLREEEEYLGIQPLEYVSNAILSARLKKHQPEAAKAVLQPNPGGPSPDEGQPVLVGGILVVP